MTQPQKVLGIETTRYSTVLRRILTAYQGEVIVKVDGRNYQGERINDLIRDWCTNRNIKRTINFEVLRGDRPIFSFHDHPDELWGAVSEEHFIASLANERLIRFRRLTYVSGPKFLECFKEVIRRLFGRNKHVVEQDRTSNGG